MAKASFIFVSALGAGTVSLGGYAIHNGVGGTVSQEVSQKSSKPEPAKPHEFVRYLCSSKNPVIQKDAKGQITSVSSDETSKTRVCFKMKDIPPIESE